jgi:hypothetical protein
LINNYGLFIAVAAVAQLAEQLICNQQVVGSNPAGGSMIFPRFPS